METLHLSGTSAAESSLLTTCLPTLHRHTFTEITLVLAGHGMHRHRGGRAPLAPGDVVIVAGPEPHGLAGVDRLQVRVLQIAECQPAWPTGITHLHLANATWRQVRDLSEQAEREFRDRRDGWQEAMSGIVRYLLVCLRRAASSGNPVQDADPAVDAACGLLESSWNRPVPVAELVHRSGLRRSTLFRRFHHIHGCSPMAWQQRLRLVAACAMLRDTALPVTTIATRCGWSDSNCFTRRFRAAIGLSPSGYRSKVTDQA